MKRHMNTVCYLEHGPMKVIDSLISLVVILEQRDMCYQYDLRLKMKLK